MNRLGKAAAVIIVLVSASLVGFTPAALAASRPSVSSVSPNTGGIAGGTRVTIRGSNFARRTLVAFGTVPARSVFVASSTRLVAVAPAHAAGAVVVHVRTAAGSAILKSTSIFTYVAAPVVTSVTPTSGSTKGGTRVTINGSRFLHVTAATFGGVPGSLVHVVSSTVLLVTAPAHSAGSVEVRVRTAYGTSAAVDVKHFTYVAPPTISAVSPADGGTGGGTSVEVTGTNFTDVTSVAFGQVAGTSLVVHSQYDLTVTSPEQVDGTVDIRVTTKYGTSSITPADSFTFIPPPVVFALDPGAGDVTGGTQVHVYIQGPYDPATASVAFGGVPAQVDFAPGVGLVATAPPHAAGTVDVQVTTPYGTSTVSPADQFHYRPASAITWGTTTTIDPIQSNYANFLTSVSCPTDTFCAAVDYAGQVMMFDGDTWSAAATVDPGGHFWSVSCPTSSFCAAVDTTGNAFTFDGNTWSAPVAIIDNAQQVSCASASFCVVVAYGKAAEQFNGSTWTATAPMPYTGYGNGNFFGVSCPTESFCEATISTGFATTFDGTSWSTPTEIATQDGNSTYAIYSLSCSSPTFCATIDAAGNVSTFDGVTWSRQLGEVDQGFEQIGISCLSSTFCAALNQDGQVVTFDGTHWSLPSEVLNGGGMSGLSCSSPTKCILVGGAGVAIASS